MTQSVSQETSAMNKFIDTIEKEGIKYGMKLDRKNASY